MAKVQSQRSTLMRTWWVVALAFVLATTFPLAETPPSVAGTWDVTIRVPGQATTEQWTIQQKGATITGIAKGARGDMPVSGSIAGASFRVTIKDGDKVYRVRAMVDGDVMDGSVTHGEGEEYSWHASRRTLTERSTSGAR
jgi:hypothetical protein